MSTTPTPWSTTGHYIYGAANPDNPNADPIADIEDMMDASLIVRAVNNFEPLLKALEGACRRLEQLGSEDNGVCPVTVAARAAIAEATRPPLDR